MKRLFTCLLLLGAIACRAQATFNSGWKIYKTGGLQKSYTYSFEFRDSVKLTLTDSTEVYSSTDSLVTLTIDYSLRDKTFYKTASYLGTNKKALRSEYYKGNAMQKSEEWKYDNKNRMIYHAEHSKVNGNTYAKNYSYEADKAAGGVIRTESKYFNGKPEFYTKDYIDKRGLTYKEICYNDNKSAVVHTESYTYDAEGRLKERQVYFPEFRVTKKFTEGNDKDFPKCYKQLLFPEVKGTINKETLLKQTLLKYQNVLTDKDCKELEYIFSGKTMKINVVKSAAKNSRSIQVTYFNKMSSR